MTPPPMTNYQYQPDSTPGVPSHQQSAFVSVTPPPVLPIRKRAPRWPIVLLICLTAIITTYMASGSGGWMPHLSTKNVFVHQATSANIKGNLTTIDNALTNGNPNAIVIVTQNWNPGGGVGTYNNHPVGVQYTGSHWAIFNEDQAAMTPQALFNVMVLNQSSSVFVQVATPDNSVDDYTIINNPLTNGNPKAIVMVTQNWNPGNSNGTYNNHPVGVWYDGSRWAIFNEDLAIMTPQVSFNSEAVSHVPVAENRPGHFSRR